MAIHTRSDFILRMIEQIVQVLLAAIGLLKRGEPEEALQQVNTGYGMLLGAFGEVVPRLDAATAAEIMGDPERVLMYARLLAAEAEIRRAMGAPEAAAALDVRSLAFARESLARGASDGATAEALIRDLERRTAADARDAGPAREP